MKKQVGSEHDWDPNLKAPIPDDPFPRDTKNPIPEDPFPEDTKNPIPSHSQNDYYSLSAP